MELLTATLRASHYEVVLFPISYYQRTISFQVTFTTNASAALVSFPLKRLGGIHGLDLAFFPQS